MTITVLEEIAASARERVREAKAAEPQDALRARLGDAPATRPFCGIFIREGLHIISEVKLASPSEGSLGEGLDPVAIAKDYAAHGAAAISVLTEPRYFRGSLDFLRDIRAAVETPLLMKDFLLDEYQLLQARAAGADAVLLIAALLGAESLKRMLISARELGLEALVEVHDEEEMKTALGAGAALVGVNNRDLKTLKVDLKTSLRLAHYAIDAVLISESGLGSRNELEKLSAHGYRGFLVGTHLIRSGRPGRALAELLGNGSAG